MERHNLCHSLLYLCAMQLLMRTSDSLEGFHCIIFILVECLWAQLCDFMKMCIVNRDVGSGLLLNALAQSEYEPDKTNQKTVAFL